MHSGAGCSELQGRLGSCGPPLIFSFNLNQNWQTAGPRPHHSPCLSVRQVWLEHSRSHVPCNGHFCSTAADSNSQDQRPRMACTSPNIYCLALYRKSLPTSGQSCRAGRLSSLSLPTNLQKVTSGSGDIFLLHLHLLLTVFIIKLIMMVMIKIIVLYFLALRN